MLKNAIIYNADLPPAGTLVDYMVERPWQDIREDQSSVSRFVPDEEGILVHEFPGGYAIRMRTDEKILPPSILTEECDKAISRHQGYKGEPLNKEEQIEVKLEVHLELLARALIKTRYTWAFYHQESQLLFVEVSTANSADVFMSELVHTCQVVKTQTINISDISQGVTERLRKSIEDPEESYFGDIAFGNYLKICRKIDGPMEKIVYSECDIESFEIHRHLLVGYRVDQIELCYAGLSFRLNPKLHFRSMDWPPFDIEVDEETGEVADHGWKVEASEKTAGLAGLVLHICSIFNYEKPSLDEEEGNDEAEEESPS